eukprot:scaffold23443_cov105-Skeletonema_marinoi.AAC.1
MRSCHILLATYLTRTNEEEEEAPPFYAKSTRRGRIRGLFASRDIQEGEHKMAACDATEWTKTQRLEHNDNGLMKIMIFCLINMGFTSRVAPHSCRSEKLCFSTIWSPRHSPAILSRCYAPLLVFLIAVEYHYYLALFVLPCHGHGPRMFLVSSLVAWHGHTWAYMGIHELMVGAVGDLEPKLYPFIAFYDYDPEVNPDQSDKS